jgi:hypothetical protein
MMAGMAIRPTGYVDRDFVATMVLHRQGALDVAEAELSYGRNAQLRRIAQEIVVDQIQEILVGTACVGVAQALAGQAPYGASAPAIPASRLRRSREARMLSHAPASGGDPRVLRVQGSPAS